MSDQTIEELTNQELADQLRDGADLQCEAVARLLEGAQKDHEALANGTMKWRCLLEELVIAVEVVKNRGGSATSEEYFHWVSRVFDISNKAKDELKLAPIDWSLPESP
jgi:hypothetical protein